MAEADYMEQWDDDDTDVLVCECERCHEVRPCRAVVDPFVAEGIWEEGPRHPQRWCRPCYESRQDDV